MLRAVFFQLVPAQTHAQIIKPASPNILKNAERSIVSIEVVFNNQKEELITEKNNVIDFENLKEWLRELRLEKIEASDETVILTFVAQNVRKPTGEKTE